VQRRKELKQEMRKFKRRHELTRKEGTNKEERKE